MIRSFLGIGRYPFFSDYDRKADAREARRGTDGASQLINAIKEKYNRV